MNTAARPSLGGYSLGHTGAEYDRLRRQARVWEAATARLLDRVGLASGASCLDAGCGPGETMRTMARRVGPSGRVLGLDTDESVGALARTMLHDAGHTHCEFRVHDLSSAARLPDGPFDLVFARLVLFHLPSRVAVLSRLWDAVAPGGHLVVPDYDLVGTGPRPALASADELVGLIIDTMTAAGADVGIGVRLPELFAEADVGHPDGTDVTGQVAPLQTSHDMLRDTFTALRPLAVARGIVTEVEADAALARLRADAARQPGRSVRWPLLIGAWKQRPAVAAPG